MTARGLFREEEGWNFANNNDVSNYGVYLLEIWYESLHKKA